MRTPDASGVVNAVAELLADPTRRAEMGRRGRDLMAAEGDMAARYRAAIAAAVPGLAPTGAGAAGTPQAER